MADSDSPLERDAAENTADGISRRSMLGLGAATLGAVAAGSLTGSRAAGAATTTYPLAPQGSTLARTLLHGTAGTLGYRHIVAGPGEKTIVRNALQAGAQRDRSATRRPLLAFAQFTDMHLIDAQSPARVEFLDRFNDPGTLLSSISPFSSAYRPWEMLTLHVSDAMVQAVNALRGGPVTGAPLTFTICTGDNSDNTQYNEVRWHINLLDGKKVTPDSGNLDEWQGVGGTTDHDSSYWHPTGSPPTDSVDNYRAKYGYPSVPNLFHACRAPFRAAGLRTPWYAVMGNHDGLVQGNIPSDALLNDLATGSVKPTGLPDGIDVAAVVAEAKAGDFAALETLFTAGPLKTVTADPRRRMLNEKQMVAEYFTTTSTPVGHGYTKKNLDDGTAYYAFTPGHPGQPGVRCISLDTVNRNGYDDGSIDTTQLAWLTAELNANSSRHLDTSGAWVKGHGTDRYILIFSHHTVATMENTLGANRGERHDRRRSAAAVPERDRLGERSHARQLDRLARPRLDRGRRRWLLGDQHRLARRLAAAVPRPRGRRQRRRNDVDLLDHHRPPGPDVGAREPDDSPAARRALTRTRRQRSAEPGRHHGRRRPARHRTRPQRRAGRPPPLLTGGSASLRSVVVTSSRVVTSSVGGRFDSWVVGSSVGGHFERGWSVRAWVVTSTREWSVPIAHCPVELTTVDRERAGAGRAHARSDALPNGSGPDVRTPPPARTPGPSNPLPASRRRG